MYHEYYSLHVVTWLLATKIYNPFLGYGGGVKRDNVSTFAVEYQRQYRAVAGNRQKEADVKVNILNLFIYLFIFRSRKRTIIKPLQYIYVLK